MIRPDMPFAEYHALDAWGSSDLKNMRSGPPALVKWRRENPSKETDATRLGTAAHCKILTPNLFDKTYVHKPEGMTFASKEGKAWRDERKGAIILTHEEWEKVDEINAAFYYKDAARLSLAVAKGVEQSVTWKDPVTGEACKGRPDWYDGTYIYDLKITRDAGKSLAYKVYVNGWLSQLAHYRSGLNENGVRVKTGRIVAIQPEPPHYVYCVEAREADLDVLALENERTLAQLQACREAGEWPGTPEEWSKIDVPAYALNETVVADMVEEGSDA